MELTKRDVQKRVLKDGKPLDLKLFEWNIKTRTFKSKIDGLVIDFTNIDNVHFDTTHECSFVTGSVCKFDTGGGCTFTTGDDCVFTTYSRCTFKTGNNCVFTTDSYCTFDTNCNCTFDTGSGCTFDVGSDSTFTTGSDCVFNTVSTCTFDTRDNCTFDTSNTCVFKTGNDCTFNTMSDCAFETGDKCTFKTKSNCKFVTGSLCTFKTDSKCKFETRNSCTFDTGARCSFITRYNCTFNTGSDCTFDTCNECIFITAHSCNFHTEHKCVIITKTTNEVIKPEPGVKITTCPLFASGYLIGSDYYLNGVKQEGIYIVADGILSKILSKKGNVYKVYTYTNYSDVFSERPTYIVQDGDIFSHGETIEEARESLIYKIDNRDKSEYDKLTIDSVVSKEEAIKMYRVITGACEFGVRDYVASLTSVKDLYTVQEIVELTNGLYGNDVLREFFKI